MKNLKTFKRTKQLNSSDSPSTGAITTYCGKSPWKAFKSPYMFLELSDCQSKVRLHNSQKDNKNDFIAKLKKLRDEINKFIDYLE